jgi:hypothetical protein
METSANDQMVYTSDPLHLYALKGAGAAIVLLVITYVAMGKPFILNRHGILLISILAPIAGVIGGFAFSATEPFRRRGGWRALVSNIIATILYLFIVAGAFCITVNGLN